MSSCPQFLLLRDLCGLRVLCVNSEFWLGIADVCSGLGEKDHAFAALELACQQGYTRMSGIRARADVNSYLRNDPRFAELLKKIGLPPLNP